MTQSCRPRAAAEAGAPARGAAGGAAAAGAAVVVAGGAAAPGQVLMLAEVLPAEPVVAGVLLLAALPVLPAWQEADEEAEGRPREQAVSSSPSRTVITSSRQRCWTRARMQ